MLSAVLSGIIDGAVLGLMALGLVLVYKGTRVLNFAQGEIGTTSIYIAWILTSPFGQEGLGQFGPLKIKGLGLPIGIGVLIALALAAGLGILMERIVIRPLLDAPKLTLTVVTLGVSTVLGGLQFAIFSERPRLLPDLISGNGPQIAGFFIEPGRILAVVVTIGLGLAFYVFFKRTMFGLGVLAAAQNPVSLRLTGLSLAKTSMFTWAGGGVLAALAGIILAPTIGAFHPFFMTLLLIPSLAAALVGGLTSLPGAFVGGIVVGVAQNLVGHFFGARIPSIDIAASFALILLVLLLRPRGLMGAEA